MYRGSLIATPIFYDFNIYDVYEILVFFIFLIHIIIIQN